MTMHVNVSGTWREVTSPTVNVSGTWREVQEGWVNVSGTWRQFYQRAMLSTTLTIGDNDAGEGATNWGFSPSFGSLGQATYTDKAPASRTILIMNWSASAVQFAITGASIPNTDSTFTSVVVNGNEFLRSAASYNGSAGGGTFSTWIWTSSALASLFTGTVPFLVK